MEINTKFITPVFLVGARRSGTTLFRIMLNGHPKVSWDRGWEFAVDLIDGRGRVRKTAGILKTPHHQRPSMEDLHAFLNKKAHQSRGEKEILGVTVHVGFKKIPHIFKNAKYIHIIRDPRDIAISSVKLGWAGSYYFAPDLWLKAEKEWDALKARIDEKQWMELKYEDFVIHPRTELQKICTFMGINYTPQLFDYICTTKYTYPKASLAYRWRQQLKKKDVQLIESRIGPYLHQRGYPSSPYPLLKPSVSDVFIHKIQNFAAIKAKGLADEGLMEYINGFLARKLKLKRLHDLHERKLRLLKKQQLKKLEKNY